MARLASLRIRWARARDRLPKLPEGLIQIVLASVVAVAVISVYIGRRNLGATEERIGLVVELLLCAAAGLVGRWTIPSALATGVVMTGLLALPPGQPRPSVLAPLIVIASLGTRGFRALSAGFAVWFFAVTTLSELPNARTAERLLSFSVGWAIIAVIAWAFGQMIHELADERVRSKVDRTAAVQAQRRTIARDLHDTIAYSTTSIILRAEQAKLRGVSDPVLAADLDYIIAAGRNSMRDLRGMMETLRRNQLAPDEPHSPWKISSLEDVLRERTAELRTHAFVPTTHVEADLAALPESVRETLAKVVVEATANMVKHGDPAGPCTIMIEGDADEIEAVFINKPAPGRSSTMSAQLGLVGARERVEALGGEVDVTSESPTWVVRVRIPLGE